MTFSKNKIVKPALLLFMGKFLTIIHKIESVPQTEIIILAIFQIRFIHFCVRFEMLTVEGKTNLNFTTGSICLKF